MQKKSYHKQKKLKKKRVEIQKKKINERKETEFVYTHVYIKRKINDSQFLIKIAEFEKTGSII